MALELHEWDELINGQKTLQRRGRAARLRTAHAIIGEDESTQNHAERLVWAEKIMDDYFKDWPTEWSWLLTHWEIQALDLTDPETQITDTLLMNAVSNLMPTLAGY